MSKYVDGSQQIVPAANQRGTICWHSSLTQLVPVSSVPPESPNAALLPHQAHKKARIVPEPYVCCALSHFCRSLTHALSNSHQPSERQEHFKLPTRMPAAKYAGAGCAAELFCAAYFLGAAPSKCPVKQHSSHRICRQCQSGGRHLSLIREQTGSGCATCDMMRLRKQGGQRGGGRQRISHTVIR